MTINAALEAVDALQPNAFSREEKLAWLSRAEGFVKTQILDTCQDPPAFSGYSSQTDPETVLLVPAPFDELYLRYIQAQMDSANGELTRYGNAAALYNSLFCAYRNYYIRTHTPVGGKLNYF